jgi:hypothetical protein
MYHYDGKDHQRKIRRATVVHGDLPPYVEGKLKPGDQDALVDLARSVSQRMFACRMESQSPVSVSGSRRRTSVGVETSMFLSIVVRWIVFVESCNARQDEQAILMSRTYLA